ncbi:MAG TPA: polysaccharide biosynthesis/export family protein [Opitutaceae bacterium]|nr:polysaccharide biosynthesis/export family protein [Opitutaceae bacterium]
MGDSAPKAEQTRPDPQSLSNATDPNYRLGLGDTVIFGVRGQGDLSASETISRNGDVRLPLIKEEITLAGKTVREAEHFLENLYRDKKLLKAPVVSLKVAAYYPRSVSVLGAVVSPGTVQFPPDTVSLDIVEVITRVGGFRPAANSDAVSVMRRGADGKETTQVLDLRNMISGRRKLGKDRLDFPILPGDRIYVPESLF